MEPDDAMLVQLRRGTLEYCVLGLLDRGERYAFDLVRELSERGLAASEGTLYPLLSRLRKDRLVTTTLQESASGPARKYYRLTDAGRARLAAFIAAWVPFRDAVDAVLVHPGEKP